MGAATRERTGRSTHRASSPSRRQHGNEPAGAAPAPSVNAPAATTLRPISRTGRLGPLLRQMVLVEAALAVAAVGAALGGPWLVPAVAVACLLVLLAVVRRRGRAVQDWLSTTLSLRDRRRTAVASAADAEPQLAPVAESVPGFAPYIYVDRDRRTVGMLGDGTFLTAVVRVEAGGESLRQALGARALPLSLLGDALSVDDIVLESAQLVQQVRPAPAQHLPQQSAARLSYTPFRSRPGRPRCG